MSDSIALLDLVVTNLYALLKSSANRIGFWKKLPFIPVKDAALITLRACVIGDRVVFASCVNAFGPRKTL